MNLHDLIILSHWEARLEADLAEHHRALDVLEKRLDALLAKYAQRPMTLREKLARLIAEPTDAQFAAAVFPVLILLALFGYLLGFVGRLA